MELDALKKLTQPVFYVTNDPSRGVGLEKILPNYHVVCLDYHPIVELMEKSGVSVFCLEKKLERKNLLERSSSEILGHPLVLSFIKEKAGNQTPNIIFFKPQKKIELIAQKNNFKLIGNTTLLNKTFEDKIGFYNIGVLENLPLLPAEIEIFKKLDFNLCAKKFGLPFVIQFGFGWAGNSTFFIDNKEQFLEIQKKFALIKVKISRYVKGITVLNNAVVLPNEIIQSPPAIQVKSAPDLTTLVGGTGGRQWPVELQDDQRSQIKQITKHVGELMRKCGYLGFFGLDFLIEDESNEVYLSENNARLTASSSFYTQLEIKNSQFPLLAYHLLAFLDQNLLKKLSFERKTVEISGSEIVGRNIYPNPVKIIKSLPAGIYDKNFNLKKETYLFDQVDQDSFWLNTVGKDRIVNPEIEMFKINTSDKVCDPSGELNDFYSKLIKIVSSKIQVENA